MRRRSQVDSRSVGRRCAASGEPPLWRGAVRRLVAILAVSVLVAIAIRPVCAWAQPGRAVGRSGTDPRPARGESQAPRARSGNGSLDLDAILEALGEKSAVYKSIALKFVCVESARSSDDHGDARKYDYMYVEAEAQRYKPYRQKHSEKPNHSGSEVDIENSFPDSYSWTLIFDPDRQHLFHFKLAGEDWFSLRRAWVIEFTAPLPYTSGQTIYEWSGRVWVDAENYNFLKVEADPANQESRLKQLLREYRAAPRFLVFPMAHRPAGAHYEITFLNQYQKLSLPDEADYHRFTLDLEGNAEMTGFETLRYGHYQFFGVDIHDRYLK